ncbi:RNA 2',3'-cyclic phosphodiesterase [Salipiger sp. P9]|uniref:RNA 2',3'-cyclic phosphodiesterase n=1 Tax=Salipiger pentaromativorans TaxID=2943193 RepID=UPI0021573620|nr:RNA 2',3'-cyclic phosphodiesterase [Salipiger pentaromativorans]MCR8547905.1 RNA 2',3'-cyclic phosphodiesterase [Salipiger pentaromativorans]
MRCFLALPIPEPLLPALLDVQEAVPVGRAVPEENLHLTLVFLDDQPQTALQELHLALESRALPGCTLALTGLALFGGRRARLLAADVARAPALMALQRAAMRAVSAAEIALPRARFRPHVTLVRFGAGLREADRLRLDAALARFAGLATPPAPVAALRLVGSVLTPEGAVYETLAEYPLGPWSGTE